MAGPVRKTRGISVSVVGADAWRRTLRSTENEIGRRMERAVKTALLAIEGRTKRKLSGEVLNKRSGTLFRNINWRTKRRGADVVGEIGTPIIYGPVHEFGLTIPRRGGGTTKMPERSFLRSSVAELQADIVRMFGREIRTAVRRGRD